MIEDTILNQFCVRAIDKSAILSSESGERAYELETIHHGICEDESEEAERLASISPVSQDTLGFELDFEVDMYPYDLTTFTSDKQVNAKFVWGGHAPGERKYMEKCRFNPGDKVLCVVHQGYDAVIPAIVVGPLSGKYIRGLYEIDSEMQLIYSSADEVIEDWLDWDWVSVIVRPLVRLKNDWEEMGEVVMIPRVYLFPYKGISIN